RERRAQHHDDAERRRLHARQHAANPAGSASEQRLKPGGLGCGSHSAMVASRRWPPWERRAGLARPHPKGRLSDYALVVRISRMIAAVSEGVLPTRTPAASRASFLACAVPEAPDTMAPAWPMVLPSGASKPAT